MKNSCLTPIASLRLVLCCCFKKMLILSVVLCSLWVNAQKTYTKAELQQDLQVFKTILINTSPVLGAQEKEQLNKSFDSAIAGFSPERASASALLGVIETETHHTKLDGHAGISIGDGEFPKSAVFFPIPIHVMDNRILVNITEGKIPYGSIIETINGKPVDQLIKQLAAPEDYYFKNNLKFIFPYTIYLKLGPKSSFEIGYKAPLSGALSKAVVPAISIEEYKGLHAKAVFPITKQDYNGLFTTNFNEDTKTYFLGIGGFVSQVDSLNVPGYFEYVFDRIFADIQTKKSEHLIIDLRDNGGGFMYLPLMLLSYLHNQNFKQVLNYHLPPSGQIPLQHLKRIGSEEIKDERQAQDLLKKIYANAKKSAHGWLEIDTFDVKRNALAFDKDVYLLVNGGTFSAASYFTSLFRAYNCGKIVGSPVGGAINNITAGVLFHYELPNTKAMMEVPLKNITFDDFVTKGAVGNYIKPDIEYPFELKYRRFLAKEDVELMEIIDGIKKK